MAIAMTAGATEAGQECGAARLSMSLNFKRSSIGILLSDPPVGEADAAAGAGQEIRLVSGMTVVDGRSRPRRLWSVVPADSGVGALCTGREVVEGEARWDPGKDVPFYPESRKHVLKIFRARFSRVVSLLEKRGLELCAREIAVILCDAGELERLDWRQDWILKIMRRWAEGAARWEARGRTAAGDPKARQ